MSAAAATAICVGIATGLVAGIVGQAFVDQVQRRRAAEAQRDRYADELRTMQDREMSCAGYLSRCVLCGDVFDNAIDGFAHMRSHERSHP